MSSRCPSSLIPRSARHLDVYRVTLELIVAARPFLPRLKRFNRRLGSQLPDALSSVLQNLAEAMRRTGADRAHLLTVALGSCDEARAILEAAVAFGVLEQTDVAVAEALADRACAMMFRLRLRCL